ncbi:MAG TPA: GT4 family glycosyltransferase PelF [Balneolales bacterium]|nr:GT4 family glycosyltransferase PelF [Balneolales bacterium]
MDVAERPTVLLATEGSYPYKGGGVSTWAQMLCEELNGQIDFIIFALSNSSQDKIRYNLPSNIKAVYNIPLWVTEDTVVYYNAEPPFSYYLKRKLRTTRNDIDNLFRPIFKDFIECLKDPVTKSVESGQVIYGLWKYFQYYDYKMTLSHISTWDHFKQFLFEYTDKTITSSSTETPHLLDMTYGMRWLYHFMMPIVASIPQINLSMSTLAGFPVIPSIVAKFEYGIPYMVIDHGVFIRERLINISNTNFSYSAKKILLDMATLITGTAYHYADRILPVSGFNKNWEITFGAEANKIEVIPNGVDTQYFVPGPKPKELNNTKTVVAVSHIFPLKDIETMIKVCEIVSGKIHDVQFIVYGSLDIDPDYTRKCQALIKRLHIEENFKLAGYHANPRETYNEGDIYLMTSISEGVPYTLLEAMSCGKPVVATDVGGISEILKDNGILCKPRDPNNIAEAVLLLLVDDAMRNEMSVNSRANVIKEFSKEHFVQHYKNIFQELLQKKTQKDKIKITLPSVNYLLRHINEQH